MPRIVYLVLGTGTPRGGHKVALRHVEALGRMGFDAVAWMPQGSAIPSWIDHAAALDLGSAFRDDDILVFPEDASGAMRQFGASPHRKVVFCQNHFYAASQGVGLLPPDEALRFGDYMACSRSAANWLARFMPHHAIEVVPAFADDRIFRPTDKTLSIACSPAKRPLEFRAIQTMLRRLHVGTAPWRWAVIQDKSEAEVAAIMGQASIFLSLSRLEGLGMSTLEAMASGCLVVGFTGLGGLEYATPVNGLWVGEDDVVACAESLARAMALVEARQPVVGRLQSAARATASGYGYASFASALEEFWQRTGRPGMTHLGLFQQTDPRSRHNRWACKGEVRVSQRDVGCGPRRMTGLALAMYEEAVVSLRRSIGSPECQ